MEVYITSKMRGHISQVTIIADLDQITTENFKVAITRRNIADGAQYCPERQYKFFAINVQWFTYTIWTLIKPMLGKKAADSISVGGNNQKEIVNNLL